VLLRHPRKQLPPSTPFERFDGCVLEPNEWTDGASFRVRLPDGRLETFRLYLVDTTESRSHRKRSDEQAAYFGLTRAGGIKLGEEAKAFTAAALHRRFTIQTRWRKVFGPTRYNACVFTADGNDLAELLLRNGLARIYGTRTTLPDGRDSRTYLATLRDLEQQAKSAGLGSSRRRSGPTTYHLHREPLDHSVTSKEERTNNSHKIGPSIAMVLFQNRRVIGHWATISAVIGWERAR